VERKISGGFMAAPLLIKLSPAQTAFKMTHSFVTISSRQFLRFFPETQLKNGFRSAGLCHASLLSREDKSELLAGVDKLHAEDVSHILEKARRAVDRWEVTHSNFLPPPLLGDALTAVHRLSDVGVAISGGYAQAERCRLSIGHKEAIDAGVAEGGAAGFPGAVAALSVSGNFMFDAASHGDFLGAVLGTGIAREKVGDIILQGEKGAQILVDPELVNFLEISLIQVRSIAVQTTAIPLTALQVKPPRVDTFRSVEASLRVDALASAGFRMSRSKLADMISGGDVRVNWKEVTKNGLCLKTGDVVSVSGKGRIEVGEITMTKKGRYAVELTRFL